MNPGHTAYIGLGSNLDGPVLQVRQALHELAELPSSRLLRHSSLYRSAPLGPPGQADYVNAVAMLATGLSAERLLDALQVVEAAHRRERTVRWGPRTLDLDILLYDDLQIATARLSLPHPQMLQRDFVVVPLYEIAPDLVLPGLGPLADHVSADTHTLVRIGDDDVT